MERFYNEYVIQTFKVHSKLKSYYLGKKNIPEAKIT